MVKTKSKEELLKDLETNSIEFIQIPDTYCFSHIKPGIQARGKETTMDIPEKVTGICVILIMHGELHFEINLQHYVAGPNSLVVLTMNSLVKLNSPDWSTADIYLLFLSPSVLQDINVNLTAIYIPELVNYRDPVIPMSKDECELLVEYLNLLYVTAKRQVNPQLDRNIATSLLAAIIYQMVQFQYSRLYEEPAKQKPQSRRLNYVHDFLKLVNAHYLTERRVNFYADKLCITNKYLSVIVRQTTGRSPGQWIDEFVGMEAKALLRYSGKNIQQVAYALNFSNQASFGKFFKNLTGMTPSQYQKS